MKLKIIADNKIPFLKGVLEDVADIRYMPGSEINRDAVKDADALLIRTRTRCNEDLLSGSGIKFIATATIGFDHIDTTWCKQNGITWTNAPGCNASSVRQYLVSALLEVFSMFNLDPQNLTIGVVGIGNVGSKVAEAAKVLGMEVLLNDPPRQRLEKSDAYCSLDEITEKADIITFHVPLTKEGPDNTFHLANESFFNSLGKSIVLINTSRGPVVSQTDLKKAIDSRQVKACILDVWEGEPHIDAELMEIVDFGTPHIAGYSTDGKVNGTVMSVQALSKYFGLGIDEWFPSEIPLPPEIKLVCDCTGQSELQVLKKIYLQTYDIKADDFKLRNDITKFESLRGNYPVRREPTTYKVRLINNNFPQLIEKLEKLGFEVQEKSL